MPPRTKKTITKPKPHQLRVRVQVLVAFNGMYAGDTADVLVDERMSGWIRAGLVKVVDDGANPIGPGAVVADDPGSLTVGAGDSSASGDEPGEGFGSGGYGAFEG